MMRRQVLNKAYEGAESDRRRHERKNMDIETILNSELDPKDESDKEQVAPELAVEPEEETMEAEVAADPASDEAEHASDEAEAAKEEEEERDPKKDAVFQLRRLNRLMHVTRARKQAERNREGGPADPSRGQGRVLSLLALKPEMTQREMNAILDMSKQSLGELLGKLEAAGFIEREHSEDDKRVVVVRLTDEGKQAARNQSQMNTRRHELDDALDVLDEAELEQFSAYLTRVVDEYYDLQPEDFKERDRARREYMKEHADEFGHGPRSEGGRDRVHGHGRGGHDHGPKGGHGGRGGFGGHGGHGGRGGFGGHGGHGGPRGGQRRDFGGPRGPKGGHDGRGGHGGFGGPRGGRGGFGSGHGRGF
jgi:DNA-binding MarR family transcriptional regulator